MHRSSSIPLLDRMESIKMLVPLQTTDLFSVVPTRSTLVGFNSCLNFQGGNENLSRERNKHRHVFRQQELGLYSRIQQDVTALV